MKGKQYPYWSRPLILSARIPHPPRSRLGATRLPFGQSRAFSIVCFARIGIPTASSTIPTSR